MSEPWQEIIGEQPAPKKKGRASRGATPWPEGQAIPAKWIGDGYAYRKMQGFPRINLNLEAERFVNRQLAVDARYVNWHRVWLNWCISPYCKGVPEQEPASPIYTPTDNDRKLIELALKGVRTLNFGPDLMRRAREKGIVTEEEARRLGY